MVTPVKTRTLAYQLVNSTGKLPHYNTQQTLMTANTFAATNTDVQTKDNNILELYEREQSCTEKLLPNARALMQLLLTSLATLIQYT